MDKQTEKELLTKFADELGNLSYTGGWLKEQLPFIFNCIDSDTMPGVYSTTFAETRKIIEQRLKDCDEEIAMRRKAYDDAMKKDIEQHNERCAKIRLQLIGSMHKAIKELEN